MPAIDAPFPKVSLQEDGSALQIGSALALFTSGQAGRGHGSHTHPIRHSFRPPDKRPTPHHPVRKKTSARPSGPNRSHGGGGPAFSQADSPEQAHTVGALFQQQGLGRVRVKGRGPADLTGCK